VAAQLKFLKRLEPTLERWKPILHDVVKATKRGRSAKEETLTGLYKDDELVMNRLVPEDNE